MKPSKPHLPTITSICGERRRCHYCGKPIGAATAHFEVDGHLNSPPTIEECLSLPKSPYLRFYDGQWAVENGYQPGRAFRMRQGQNWKGEFFTRIWFWTGRFRGYGYTDIPSLFCNQHEAALFGLAAWHSGVRMKRDTDPTDRS